MIGAAACAIGGAKISAAGGLFMFNGFKTG